MQIKRGSELAVVPRIATMNWDESVKPAGKVVRTRLTPGQVESAAHGK
jgi:hypothetical protein